MCVLCSLFVSLPLSCKTRGHHASLVLVAAWTSDFLIPSALEVVVFVSMFSAAMFVALHYYCTRWTPYVCVYVFVILLIGFCPEMQMSLYCSPLLVCSCSLRMQLCVSWNPFCISYTRDASAVQLSVVA